MNVRPLFFYFVLVVLIALAACSSGKSEEIATPAIERPIEIHDIRTIEIGISNIDRERHRYNLTGHVWLGKVK